MPQGHTCLNGEPSEAPSWWAKDGRGIPLCRVCDRCKAEKLSHYRPEVLKYYDQSVVDEPIEVDCE